jgi:hypothetical protein
MDITWSGLLEASDCFEVSFLPEKFMCPEAIEEKEDMFDSIKIKVPDYQKHTI